MEHNNRVVEGYTSRRTPVELVVAENFDSIVQAIARERQIKGWSQRKKEALIRGGYEELPDLASRPKKR